MVAVSLWVTEALDASMRRQIAPAFSAKSQVIPIAVHDDEILCLYDTTVVVPEGSWVAEITYAVNTNVVDTTTALVQGGGLWEVLVDVETWYFYLIFPVTCVPENVSELEQRITTWGEDAHVKFIGDESSWIKLSIKSRTLPGTQELFRQTMKKLREDIFSKS